jgi:DNA invertase Pin-like site-specific DNA recombinase
MVRMTDRAGRWIRVSGDSQSEADQLPDINRYCDEQGYVTGPVFTVHGKSAYKGAQDPDWQRVVADISNGQIDVVVCWMVDRLDRQNILHAIPMVSEVLDAGGRIEFSEQPDSNLDKHSPNLDAELKAFSDRIHAAHSESRIKSKRILKNHRTHRETGALIGRAAWGYRIAGTKHHKKLVPTDEGRKFVPLIFQAVIDGKSTLQIAAWLDSELGGRRWNESVVNYIIRNPTYYGHRPNSGALETEALVSVQKWQEAQHALASRYRPGRETVSHPKALLKPICGACLGKVRDGCPSGRSPMRRTFVGKAPWRMEYYRCSGHGPQHKGCGARMIQVKALNAAVLEEMFSYDMPHEDYVFIPGDDRSEQIAKLRERGAEAMRKGDYSAATEVMQQAEQLEALPRVAPHWERQVTDQSEAEFFMSLDPADWREYIARRYEVIGEMTDRGATAAIAARELV